MSSIHISPVKGGSESHNLRQKEMPHVREDLKHLNSHFYEKSIADCRAEAEHRCKELTGRSMQAKATPIREGVLLIDKHHTADDLKRLAIRIEKEFGVKTIQGYCHKDEGHYHKDTREWKPNHHAHMVFDWTNHQTGKSIKLNREDMSRFQDVVAQELKLERGKSSSIKHVNALAFRNMKEQKELEERHGKDQALKSVGEIKQEGQLYEANLKYLKEKGEDLSKEVQKVERKLEQKRQQSRDFGFEM